VFVLRPGLLWSKVVGCSETTSLLPYFSLLILQLSYYDCNSNFTVFFKTRLDKCTYYCYSLLFTECSDFWMLLFHMLVIYEDIKPVLNHKLINKTDKIQEFGTNIMAVFVNKKRLTWKKQRGYFLCDASVKFSLRWLIWTELLHDHYLFLCGYKLYIRNFYF
jgi:hypothetical protein